MKILSIFLLLLFIVACEPEFDSATPPRKEIPAGQPEPTPEPEPIPEPAPEPAVTEPVDVQEPTPESATGAKTHIIEIDGYGFNPKALTVKVGDIVVWKNVRTGNLNKALVVGSRACVDIRSPVLRTNETFVMKADEARDCQLVEAITKVQTGTLLVE